MLDVLETIEDWLRAGETVALATVVATWGSAPRGAGAKMGVRADMGMVGSVSGGCVESAVLDTATDVLIDAVPRLLHFGVADETAWEVGLACGGKLSVYVEALDTAWWQCASARVRADHPFATATLLTGAAAGQRLLVDADGIHYHTPGLPDAMAAALTALAHEGIACRTSSLATVGDAQVFVDVYRPRPRLMIVGGAHAAPALAQMAALLGFRVFVIDPRRAFATVERFPAAEQITHEYPDKALPRLGLTADTYIAILTHDPKIDDPALHVALPSAAAYVGILSGKRSHAQRRERLLAGGLDAALLARLHTPIGLDIGAQTPEEIALCILAEIVGVRNGRA
ncbi:MAG: XdhC family protein [Chloroflexota bacterium]|nr:XdhC family protein [Chloroflexota bacterium]